MKKNNFDAIEAIIRTFVSFPIDAILFAKKYEIKYSATKLHKISVIIIKIQKIIFSNLLTFLKKYKPIIIMPITKIILKLLTDTENKDIVRTVNINVKNNIISFLFK